MPMYNSNCYVITFQPLDYMQCHRLLYISGTINTINYIFLLLLSGQRSRNEPKEMRWVTCL